MGNNGWPSPLASTLIDRVRNRALGFPQFPNAVATAAFLDTCEADHSPSHRHPVGDIYDQNQHVGMLRDADLRSRTATTDVAWSVVLQHLQHEGSGNGG